MFTTRIILTVTTLMLMATPAAALDQATATATSSRPFKDIREEYRYKVQELRGEIKETRVEAREALTSATSVENRSQGATQRLTEVKLMREEKIIEHARKITARLTAALERSMRFIDRIENILAERENRGQPVGNMEAVKAKLTEAKNLIPTAQTLADELPNKVAAVVAGATTTTKYANIRNLVTEAVQAVRDVHAKVVEAVRLIKAAPETPVATTTPAE